jgi:hypothetical protein
LKQIVWDIAATVGTENFSAIYRELEQKLRQLHKKEELYEDETPDIRTLHRIIELDIQRLSPEVVVAKLPRHVWHLRHDYEDIKLLAEENIQAEQKAQKEVIAAIASKIWELLESELSKLIQGATTEIMGRPVQAEAYDANHVAVSRKRALAEVMCKELANVAPNGIYSLTAIQSRLLKSIPERRIECLRESLGGLGLTPAEEETLAGALTESGLAERLREYAEPLYRRIKALERHHYPLTTSDVMLIRTAAEMDDDQFNKVLKVPSYNEEPDYNADVISAATKLLLDVGEQVVLLDEVEKDTRMGSTKEAATSTAQGRMELAKRLAASWLPRFIRAFARRLANETKPATGWVKAENG